eukprot:TRINITY_DN8933_c0_g3_i1.p2 TRINITY_DN8933_c0_g3~~TRINITY_DN8933_c0_g3_i1.p2  ORF type:complete len:396 (+),score=89.05 TRINITY_DN8933_c0_g3_i1:2068-3255(+)
MQVYVREEDGSLMGLEVEGGWNVLSLKEEIGDRSRIGVENLVLVVDGKELKEDGALLAEVGLEADAVIEMRLSAKELARRKLRELGVKLCGKEVIRAAWECNVEVLELLTKAGVDVNERGFGGWTALMSAAPNGDTEMIRLLAETGDLSNVHDAGLTALMLGAQTGQPTIVKLLLESNADLTVTDVYGNTALEIAVAHGHLETAAHLLEASPESSYRGLLNVAVSAEQPETLEMLLKMGLRDAGGMGALHTAAQMANLNMADIIICHTNKVDVVNDKQMTPLMVAVQAGSEPFVRFLVDHGADLTAVDVSGWSPVFYAAQYRRSSILDLVTSVESVNTNDVAGWTPLHVAAQHGHSCTVSYLLRNSANPLIRCHTGVSPKDIALQKGHKLVASLL